MYMQNYHHNSTKIPNLVSLQMGSRSALKSSRQFGFHNMHTILLGMFTGGGGTTVKKVAVEWQKWWQWKRLKSPCFQGLSAFGGSSGSTFNSEEGKGIKILWVIVLM